MAIRHLLQTQQFTNGYELVDGVEMHSQNGDQFQIPPDILKKYIRPGYFVELRLDSPRFCAHPDAPAQCRCEHCNGEASKPILGHDQPATLVPLPDQDVPSRGWGEDFWVQVQDREGDYFSGIVDNPLYEARLHGVRLGIRVAFHINHILMIHPSHRQDMVMQMNETDLKELVSWLGLD